ncbi:hypothetical protein [Actinacidiphila reveromycinica]|nr:hypothetical protein [Streptomyces sp. SN-593]
MTALHALLARLTARQQRDSMGRPHRTARAADRAGAAWTDRTT